MRKLTFVLALVATVALATVSTASAGVERYQFSTLTIADLDANDRSNYQPHYYTVRHNPCTDTWEDVTSYYTAGPNTYDENLSGMSLSGNAFTFTSTYVSANYSYTATLTLGEEGTVSLESVDDDGGIITMAGTWSMEQSSYNHGEYVAESIDEYGPDTHSCIGKPMVSGGR